MKIEHVDVHVVAPRVQRYTWSHDLPEQFMTNTTDSLQSFWHHAAFMRRLRPSLLVADVFVGKVEVLLPIKFGYVMFTSADVIADAAVHGLVHLRPPFRR